MKVKVKFPVDVAVALYVHEIRSLAVSPRNVAAEAEDVSGAATPAACCADDKLEAIGREMAIVTNPVAVGWIAETRPETVTTLPTRIHWQTSAAPVEVTFVTNVIVGV